jgi:hypothetical protein
MVYRFPVVITDVFERKEKRHSSGAGDAALFETYSGGWYVQLNHSTSIYVGMEKPEFEIGEKISMLLQRSQNAQAS